MKFVDTLKTVAEKFDGEKVLRGVSYALTLGGLFVASKLQNIDHDKIKAELKKELLEEHLKS